MDVSNGSTLLSIYALAMGYGTEAGSKPYQLTVVGGVNNPMGASGYSLGVIQVDFGQQSSQVVSQFVDLVQSWAAANGMSLTDPDSVLASLQSHNTPPNYTAGFIPLQSSDAAVINAWAAVPENQSQFFETFEQPLAMNVINGTNGYQVGLAEFTQDDEFQSLPVSQQIAIVVMLAKAGNQGGQGGFNQALAQVDAIPSGELSEESVLNALTGSGSKLSATLQNGIVNADIVGDTLAQINSSSLLSPLLSNATSLDSYDSSSVSQNPDALIVATLLGSSVANAGSNSSYNYVQESSAVNSFINQLNSFNGVSGAVYVANGSVIGIDENGGLFVSSLTAQGNAVSYQQINGVWTPIASESSSPLISQQNGNWQFNLGSATIDLGQGSLLNANGAQIDYDDNSVINVYDYFSSNTTPLSGANSYTLNGSGDQINTSNSKIVFAQNGASDFDENENEYIAGALWTNGSNNQISVTGGAANITMIGGGNSLSGDSDISGSSFTLEATGVDADTINFNGITGLTGITANLVGTTTEVDLGENTALSIDSISGGGFVTGVSGDNISLTGGGVTLNATGGQYNLIGTNDIANVTGSNVYVTAGSSASLAGSGNIVTIDSGSSLSFNSNDSNIIQNAVGGQTLTVNDGQISVSDNPIAIAGGVSDTVTADADGSQGVAVFNINNQQTAFAQINTDGSSTTTYFDPTTQQTTQIASNFSGGGSEIQNFTDLPDGVTEVDDIFTGSNELGSEYAEIAENGNGTATIQFAGGSVVLAQSGFIEPQDSNGGINLTNNAGDSIQITLPGQDGSGDPIAFSGITSMTLNPDGTYSIVDQSGNSYTLQSVSGTSNYLLSNVSGSVNVTVAPNSVSDIDLGQYVNIETSVGNSIVVSVQGGSGTLSSGNLGDITVSQGSALTIGSDTVNVTSPEGSGTNQFQFNPDGSVSTVATYDGPSDQTVPSSITTYNEQGYQTQLVTNYSDGTSLVTSYNAANPSAGYITQTQLYTGSSGSGSLVTQTTNFTSGLSEIDQYNPQNGVSVTKTTYTQADGGGAPLSQINDLTDGTSTVTTYQYGSSSGSGGLAAAGITAVTTTYSGVDGNGIAQGTTYTLGTGAASTDASIGQSLGSAIGNILGGNSAIDSIAASTVLGTIGEQVGNIIAVDGATGDMSATIAAVANVSLPDLAGDGAGAVGAYLTGELVKDVGLAGVPAEVIDTGAGYAVSTIATNLGEEAAGVNTTWDAGLSLAGLANASGGFLGSELASEIADWSTPTEEELASIGAAVGGAIGSILGPLGTFAGDFLGDLIGGLLGSLFGGHPNSWVHGVMDINPNSSSPYYYVEASEEENGPASYASSIGNAISTEMNAIIADVGGTVSNAAALNGTLSFTINSTENWIQVKMDNLTSGPEQWKGPIDEDSAETVISWAVYNQLAQLNFSGGNIYVERAINATLAEAAQSGAQTVDMTTLLGNIQLAQDYQKYLDNTSTINSLIALNPASDFSAGWLLELQQIDALGLNAPISGAVELSPENSTIVNGISTYNQTSETIDSFIDSPYWLRPNGETNDVVVSGSDISLDVAQNNLNLTFSGSSAVAKLTGNSNVVVINGSDAQFSGDGNDDAVTENGDFDSLSLYGNDALTTVNGQSATITIFGQQDSVQVGSGSVVVADGSSVTINGISDTIGVGNSSTLVVNGSQMTVNADGNNNVITTNGNQEQIAMSGYSNTLVANGQQDDVQVDGSNETLTMGGGLALIGDASSANISGQSFGIDVATYSTLQISGQSIGVTLDGGDNSITLNGISSGISGSSTESSVTLNGNSSSININGDNDTIDEYGNYDSLISVGTGNVLIAYGQGDTISVGGTEDALSTGGSAVTVQDESDLTINGAGDSVSLGNDDQLAVNGNSMGLTVGGTSNTVTANGLSNSVTDNGGNNTITENGSTGDVLVTNSNGDTLTLNGNSGLIVANGSDDSLFANGVSNQIDVNGIQDLVNTAGTTIAIESGAQTTLLGGNNTITVASDASVTESDQGSNITVYGASSTLNANVSYDTIIVEGVGDSVTENGEDNIVQISGQNNNVSLNSYADTVSVEGVGNSVNVNGSMMSIGSGVQANLSGNGNDISMASWSTLTETGSGYSNNWIQANSGDNVTLSGNGQGVQFSGTGDDLTARNGTGQYAYISSGRVTLETNAQLSLTGSSNTVTVAAGAVLSAVGNSNSIVASGSGDNISTIGINNSVQLSNGTLDISTVSGGNSGTGFSVQGVDFPSADLGDYGTAASTSSMQALAQTGANSVTLVATQYVDSTTSSTITTTSADGTLTTESNANLIATIQQAEADGLNVLLSPHLNIVGADGSQTWQAELDPTDIATFFQNYTTVVLNYAEIAQQTGVKTLSIGDELSSLDGTQYVPYWDALIAQVRQVYSGQLTYSSAWNNTANVGFWSELDVIGANAYIPVTNITDPTLDELEQGWTTVSSDPNAAAAMDGMSPVDFYQSLSQEYGKSVVFTEIGYRSVNGTNMLEGSNANTSSTYEDYQQQALAYQAFFNVWSEDHGSWMLGAYAWDWNPNPSQEQADDFSLQNKPALDVLESWYEGTANAATPIGSNTLTGNSNTVNFSGSNQTLIVSGSDNTINVTGSNDAIGITGANNTVDYTEGTGELEIANTGAGAGTVLQLGSGMSETNISVSTDSAGDVVLTDGVSGDLIQIDGMLDDSAAGISQVEFANGTTWTASQLDTLARMITGTAGSDTLVGDAPSGNIFNGNGGNDIEIGNGGNDTFIFNPGYGDLEISENYASMSTPILQLGSGISESSLSVTTSSNGNNLILTDGITGDRVTLDNMASEASWGVAEVQFADGTVWNASQLLAMATEITATGLSQTLSGTPMSDVFESTYSGDTEAGDGGNDTYILQPTEGALTVVNGIASNNQASGNLSILNETDDNIWFKQVGNDLEVAVMGTSTEATIQGWFTNGYNQLHSISVTNSSGSSVSISNSQVEQLVQAMAAYSAQNPGFDPTSINNPAITDSTLLSLVSSSYHAA